MLAARWSRFLLSNSHNIPLVQQTRSRWQNKIRVHIYPCLEERLDELDVKKDDPEVHQPVNIGLPQPFRLSRQESLGRRLKHVAAVRANPDLEKQARLIELLVDLDSVQAEWEATMGPHHIRILAQHYDIFTRLFGNAFFIPYVLLRVNYPYEHHSTSPVYRGNTIKPREATCEPTVEFPSEPDDLWTLALTNPDGNLVDSDSECLHWLVGNIKGGDVRSGEVLCDYLQPFPPRGSGYHRYVFLLYKQDGHVDFSQYRREQPCLSLKGRSFSTLEFYRHMQDHLTPAGLSWFQADWDASLTDFFHYTLKMREPLYEYDFPEVYVAPPKFFPHKRQFNTYLDLHRDPKEIKKEMLLQRLKKLDPLEPEPPVLPFPNAQPLHKDLTSWERRDIKMQRLGIGKYSELYRGANRPRV